MSASYSNPIIKRLMEAEEARESREGSEREKELLVLRAAREFALARSNWQAHEAAEEQIYESDGTGVGPSQQALSELGMQTAIAYEWYYQTELAVISAVESLYPRLYLDD